MENVERSVAVYDGVAVYDDGDNKNARTFALSKIRYFSYEAQQKAQKQSNNRSNNISTNIATNTNLELR